MNFHDIQGASFVNGEGIRVVLWVSGCNHRCDGCHNKELWDPQSGIPFTDDDAVILLDKCSRQYIDGLTLSGGDPMYPDNRQNVLSLCQMFKKKFGDKKTIWMYTGYEFEDIKNSPILKYVDVIVDGKFVKERANEDCMWRGSGNQRIWKRNGDIWELIC